MNFLFMKTPLIFLLLCLISSSAKCDVSLDFLAPSDNQARPVMKITLKRSITAKDYSNITYISGLLEQKFGQKPAVLSYLDSTGGDVASSLQIGRFLRKSDALATVWGDAKCLSACVYILAGAPHRAVGGVVGIHRPYDPNGKETSEVAQKQKYKNLGTEIMAYLQEMNIPENLYEDSLFISPERIKILTQSDLQRYGLSEDDPYTNEADAAKKAKNLNLTRQQYAKLSARANQKCELMFPSPGEERDEEALKNAFKFLQCKDGMLNRKR